jgi:NADH dehydrogenase
VIPISGSGRSAYQPIWAADVARCVISALEQDEPQARYELGGPEVLTYDEIALTIARAAGRERPLAHVPLGLVHLSLIFLRRLFGDAVFATWEEAELMEVPMTTARGTADAQSLGVEPLPVRDVLTGAGS